MNWEDIKATLIAEGFELKEDDNKNLCCLVRCHVNVDLKEVKTDAERITVFVPRNVKTRNGEIIEVSWVVFNGQRDDAQMEYEDCFYVTNYGRYVRLDKLIDWVHNPLGF